MKLTTDQQIRVDIIHQYLNGQIFPEDACAVLRIKERQFRRLVKSFREEGLESVLHGNVNRSPANKLSIGVKTKLICIYKNKYSDFNLVHFREELQENEYTDFPYIPCYSTIRNLFLREGLITVKKKRGRKIHKMRKRYEKEGLMVQIDGSPHHWLNFHAPFCLTAAIDDATGKLLAGKFTKTETTFAAMDVVEKIIKKNGCFQMLYSDRAGIYGGGKRDGFSNMNKAMEELGILSLQATTPQGKGKVERLFGTLQSRLTAEMRLKGIQTIDQANEYFDNEFIDYFNGKFAKVAADVETAYRELDPKIDLNEIFTKRVDRQIRSGHVVNYDSDQYLVTNEEFGSLVKRPVENRHYRDGNMKIFLLTGEQLEYELIEKQKQAA